MSDVPVLGYAGDRVDLLIRQGATFGPHELTLTNPDDTVIDLTGCTLRAQVRRKALDAAILITLTCTITDATGGVCTIGLTDEQTAALAAGEDPGQVESRARWDLELEDAAGRVTPVFYGNVVIHREVTR
jgi:hypothetical protein